jgi:hypothetical protein
MLGAGLAGHLAAKSMWQKRFFWGTGLLIVVLIYFQARSYKEPPTAEDIANAVQKKVADTHNTDTQALATPIPLTNGAKSKPTKSGKPKRSTSSAHLTVTQSTKISTRADAPVETEVVVQTDRVFPTLKFVMQCDQRLIDAQPTIGGSMSLGQMSVSSGVIREHPNVVVYSYGSSAPPFGPANPLVIDVWSKEPVTCNQVATF